MPSAFSAGCRSEAAGLADQVGIKDEALARADFWSHRLGPDWNRRGAAGQSPRVQGLLLRSLLAEWGGQVRRSQQSPLAAGTSVTGGCGIASLPSNGRDSAH